jgi:hypothetical protein
MQTIETKSLRSLFLDLRIQCRLVKKIRKAVRPDKPVGRQGLRSDRLVRSDRV